MNLLLIKIQLQSDVNKKFILNIHENYKINWILNLIDNIIA